MLRPLENPKSGGGYDFMSAYFATSVPPFAARLRECRAAASQRTLPPGTSGCDAGHLASSANSRPLRVGRAASVQKKGVLHLSTPQSPSEELPLLCGFLLSTLGSLLRHFFLLRLL
jgi:hypothetical protein